MNRPTTTALAILSVSLVGAAVSTYFMSKRVAAFNATLPDPFLFKAESRRTLGAFGRAVKIEDATLESEGGAARAAIKVTYGESSVTIPVIAPKVPNFKDLSAYEDSFRVLSFAPIVNGKADIDPFGDKNWRAVVVARQTRPGYDQDTWGEVRVKDWSWQIYELCRDGTISGPRLVQYRDRKGRTPAEVYAREQLAATGQPVPPLPEQGGPRLTSVEPIDERTWEWQAALFATPKMQISRYRYRTDAVDGTAHKVEGGAPGMGWTFPAAGFSVLGIMLGSGLLMAARTPRRPDPRVQKSAT